MSGLPAVPGLSDAFEVTLLVNPSEEDISREAYRQTQPLTFSESTFGIKPISSRF